MNGEFSSDNLKIIKSSFNLNNKELSTNIYKEIKSSNVINYVNKRLTDIEKLQIKNLK